jgi:hypothetical protein
MSADSRLIEKDWCENDELLYHICSDTDYEYIEMGNKISRDGERRVNNDCISSELMEKKRFFSGRL